jgi:nucleoid-associated protein YgaU
MGKPTTPKAQPAGNAEPVVVRGGDSLWSIAADRLPPDSSAADIDSAWRAWYFANERVIGDNPDLIQPGQLLLPPTTKEGSP